AASEPLGVQPARVPAADYMLCIDGPVRRRSPRGVDDPGVSLGWGDRSPIRVEEEELAVGNVELFHRVGRPARRLLGLEVVGRTLDRFRRRYERSVETPGYLRPNRQEQTGAEQQQDERERRRVPQREANAQPAKRHPGSPRR